MIFHELETERLILRKFREDDFPIVHEWASCPENVRYMPFGPNTEDETRAFVNRFAARSEDGSDGHFEYIVTIKGTGTSIGSCGIGLHGDAAEVGWILHRDFHKRGFGTEIGRALLDFGFSVLNARRITARCDSENYSSYHLMEKIGMRREGRFIQSRRGNRILGLELRDELSYAILKDEWETRKEIAYYNALPVAFGGFIELPELSDGEIRLVCSAKNPPDPVKGYIPNYHFLICKGSEKAGEINLRIGYNDKLYYGGQIGYGVDEKYRGSGCAGRACRLLTP